MYCLSVLYIFQGFIKCMKYVTNPSTQYKYVVFIFKIKILSRLISILRSSRKRNIQESNFWWAHVFTLVMSLSIPFLRSLICFFRCKHIIVYGIGLQLKKVRRIITLLIPKYISKNNLFLSSYHGIIFHNIFLVLKYNYFANLGILENLH